MTTGVGLRAALTTCAFLGLLAAPWYASTLESKVADLFTSWAVRIWRGKSHSIRLNLSCAFYRILRIVRRRQTTILDLPAEIRNNIYGWVCTRNDQGSVKGAVHILHLNRQVRREAQPYFDSIEHIIQIGDLSRHQPDTEGYLGSPCLIRENESLVWDTSRLRHLALEIKVVSIGDMKPDCFDIMISPNAKTQWRGLKQLIGIWPKTRETPLESIRIDLSLSEYTCKDNGYRADLIRIIRNFKRTRIWAETGDCSKRKENKSVLLPLARAFNQGRRNWVAESSEDQNLIVRFDAQYLKNRNVKSTADEKQLAAFEADRARWSIVPVNDTTRSENSHWPEWTGKEATYISEKMIRKEYHELDSELSCRECLATFLRPGHLRDHVGRGVRRPVPSLRREEKQVEEQHV